MGVERRSPRTGRGARRGALPRRREGGAIAVETALLAPVLLVFLLGIVELSMFIRDYVAVTSAARTGVRVAAAAPDAGRCVNPVPLPAGDTSCPTNGVPNFAKIAADAISRAGTALPKESIDHVMVYKANSGGYPGSLSSMPASCGGVTNCVMYTWRPTLGAFRYASGSWDSRQVNACFPNNVDAVGVQVAARHDFLSGMFGQQLTMKDHAVMNFEPLPVATCAAGQHE